MDWHTSIQSRGAPDTGRGCMNYLCPAANHTHTHKLFPTAAAAAAAKSLQSCPTLWDPIDGIHQAPLSLGSSRQKHWSGLPFPSPKHESEQWKWSHSVMSNFSRPDGLQPTRLLRPWDFPGKSTNLHQKWRQGKRVETISTKPSRLWAEESLKWKITGK